jgi:hypothetical protein
MQRARGARRLHRRRHGRGCRGYDSRVWLEPPCEVASLAVFSAAEVMWSIHSGVGRNALVPPVRYGEVPRGGVEETRAAPLQHGFGYFVRVFRLDRNGEELVHVEAGEATFRH